MISSRISNFNTDIQAFKQIMQKAEGQEIIYGDAGFLYHAFARVPLAMIA